MFLKTKQKKALINATKLADKVLELESKYSLLSIEELKSKTLYFKKRIDNGATIEDLIIETFAVAREVGYRALGLKAYKVQIIGAILIANGYIAEMQTGEGKTLTEIMPAYLMGLFGNGVHIVTANDYLAKRDCEWMSPVYEFLGLSCSYIIGTSSKEERKFGYSCDITYVTNNEIAFDYLRDNMVTSKADIVLDRRFGFAIIDEADSILIDEARTPFIISGKTSDRIGMFSIANTLAKELVRGEDLKELGKMDYLTGNTNEDADLNCDYRVDTKNKSIVLTKSGMLKIENYFNCGYLSDPKNSEILHCMLVSLRANAIMKNMEDYIVKDGEILCVDSFTGRTQPGRRFINGLHQAIEAKENVEVKAETITTATITFQTLFNMYEHKAGMTGTAITEAKELMDIYKLIPIAVPTNVPTKREDLSDEVYRTCEERDMAIVSLVKEEMQTGRPILIGTPSIDASERISNLLNKYNIQHNVLNAKNHELEAHIIEVAGEKNAITVATNMAGRGTDIKISNECKEQGLLVIGTARHDSRRIDNQLRGRAGRQGDSGKSVFMLSTDDDLLKFFGGKFIKTMLDTINSPEGVPLSHPLLMKELEIAQKTVESQNFEKRKQLYEYDTIVANQCNVIYKLREEALKGGIMNEIPETIADFVDFIVTKSIVNGKIDENIIKPYFIGIPELENIDIDKNKTIEENANIICELITNQWKNRKNEFETFEEFEDFSSIVFLKTLDNFWAQHINAMTELRKNIHLKSYAQKDPLVEYKTEGGEMFVSMLEKFKPEVTRALLLAKMVRNVETIEQPIENESNIDIDEVEMPQENEQ